MTALAGTAMLAHGDTPTRGKYAPQLKGHGRVSAAVYAALGPDHRAGAGRASPMHGHGFALMFLASRLRHDHQSRRRATRIKAVIAERRHAHSPGQSGAGGWTYIPGSGDEGSVTVTQVQALRAAHNAGFLVPRGTIEEAVQLIERCRTPEGRHPLFARLRRRAAAGDLGRGRGHALQRRPVRRARSPNAA